MIWAGLTPSCASSERTTCWSGCKQSGQQVHRLETLVPAFACQRLGLLHGLLALERELVEAKGHLLTSFSSNSTSMTSSGLPPGPSCRRWARHRRALARYPVRAPAPVLAPP